MKSDGHHVWSRPLRLALMVALIRSLGPGAIGLAAADKVAPYSGRTWQADEGLPHDNVEAIAQTGDGYLWVGTEMGLARFDGIRFAVFNAENTSALKNASITALCRSRDGSLWIGTDGGGVTQLKEGRFLHHALSDEPQANRVICALAGRDGSLWVGTWSGLFQYEGGTWRRFTTKEGLLSDTVRSLCENRDSLWIGTDQGLNVRQAGQMRSQPELKGSFVRTVFADRSGNLWIGSRQGLARLSEAQLTRYTKRDGLADDNVTAGYEDERGNFWVGSTGGLNRFGGRGFSTEQQANGSFYAGVNCFFEDREGTIWVGTWYGLHQLRPRRFTTYTQREGLTHDRVTSILEDKSGNIWMSTWGGGLVELRGQQMVSYTKADYETNGLATDWLLSLCEASDGSILAGADYGDGVFRFRDGKFTRCGGPGQAILSQIVQVICCDREGRLWFGAKAGLTLWDTRDQWLPERAIQAILEDHTGKLWVGTDKGLFCRQQGQFSCFTTNEGLSHNWVTALYEDKSGELWIGTAGGGLNRFRDGLFSAYSTQQGLFNDQIGEILEDGRGCFWLSCLKGIFCVSRKALDDWDARKITTIPCVAYDKEDGLATVQCSDFAKPAAWKGRDGRLWFATTKGVAVIDPESNLNVNPLAPPVHIEEIIADQKSVRQLLDPPASESASAPGPGLVPSLTIPPGRGELEVHYTALSFQAPGKNQFKYKLEGMDAEWVEAGTRRVAYYNNLPPGRYQFRVVACNNDRVWNQAGAALGLVVSPHAWQTWWFKVLAASCVGMFLAGLYRLRVSRVREIERLRLRIAADLHDQVGSSLGTISLMSNWMQQNAPREEQKDLATIHRLATHIADAIRDVVWFINPEYDTLEDLLSRMRDTAGTTLGEINWRFDEPSGDLSRRLPVEFRQNVFLMFKETLANVAKHAKATQVEIKVAAGNGVWEMSVRDDGTGFDSAAPPKGNGLKNLRRRAEKLKGTLEIRSQKGGSHGTSVSFMARLL